MAQKVLLDYFFPITVIEPTPAASTAFLNQACLVCLPKSGATAGLYECDNMTEVAAQTDNTEAQQLFNAGMTKVFILINATLDIDTIIDANLGEFYTLIISSDFNKTAIDAMDKGAFEGVVAASETDDTWLATWSAISKQCGFHTTSGNKAKNMCYALGKLLSNTTTWKNQQYITMPFADDVDTTNEAVNLFDDRISFVISDAQYGNRLGFMGCGGQAIVAPYIIKNLEIDMQSAGLSYIAENQPDYNVKQATLLEDSLQAVIARYIATQEIVAGTVSVNLVEDNFVATGAINVSEPKAMWRINATLQQTL